MLGNIIAIKRRHLPLTLKVERLELVMLEQTSHLFYFEFADAVLLFLLLEFFLKVAESVLRLLDLLVPGLELNAVLLLFVLDLVLKLLLFALELIEFLLVDGWLLLVLDALLNFDLFDNGLEALIFLLDLLYFLTLLFS